MNLALSLYTLQEREVVGLIAHPPLLLIIIPILKDLKPNNIYAWGCARVSIVIFKGERDICFNSNNSEQKKHNLSLLIEIDIPF